MAGDLVSSLDDYEIRALLQKYGVTPTRKAGQSFLKDVRVAQSIVDAAELSGTDSVLEIGGGLGILTQRLSQVAGHVKVIELEPKLVKALTDACSDLTNVEIVQGDALQVELGSYDRVVSNLPYSVSSEVTFRLLKECTFKFAVLMYQKEFAQRLVASPGGSDYSRLTIDFNYLGSADWVMDVHADRFYPRPAVNSAVLRVTHREGQPRAQDQDSFFWMVHGLYSYPNKQLGKAASIWFRLLGMEKSDVEHWWQALDSEIDTSTRLRNLTQEDLIVLADGIYRLVQEGVLHVPEPK